jgi:hypothetical protein
MFISTLAGIRSYSYSRELSDPYKPGFSNEPDSEQVKEGETFLIDFGQAIDPVHPQFNGI